MKAYQYVTSEKCMILAAVKDRTHPFVSSFDGESKLQNWTFIEIETLYKKKYDCFPHYLCGVPIFSEKVKLVLEPYLNNEVEFLPLGHKHLKLYAINVTNVLDCVDWDRSDIQKFNDGSFAGFNKLVFDFTKIPPNTYIFKYKERATTYVYVTELFKELVEKFKLKGLDFSNVFDSEWTEERELQQQRIFEEKLVSIEQNKGPEFSYDQAVSMVNEGFTVQSGKWRMQLDAKGQFLLGELLKDLSYQWIKPTFIPPILLCCPWHVTQPSSG
ncbi:hypothetical protein M3223_02710 [Paenibacillus pasadenensis]|uniref:imm11 family protein n=1 Tax=Paenibacillus pasadenensis TaxID=217090 RepID=UPI00203E31B7|nr:DUF1629 domain-containing protein [Paenibacillus pasadenensis]MCM3746257.1 hypothetical protein [Paenibacillus pasadenensis]